MERNVIENQRLRESYTEVQHPSGLRILVLPKRQFNKTYAVFATRYGSVDNRFSVDGGPFMSVPDGIAHFLEHKLFESEDGNAFDRYAKTGASANAFTSFDMTAYLFSCTENFKESLDILLDFVQNPYFTKESVEKEQGIIGQEIRMYDDDANWRVYFNLLRAVYHRHPARIDIAGTVESIADITHELLYSCYNTFYNLSNMVLCVCGDTDMDEVLEVADKRLKAAKPVEISRDYGPEPSDVARKRIEQRLSVNMPLFNIGIKDTRLGLAGMDFARKRAAVSILLELLAGESSPFYRRLYNEGLINSNFGVEYTGSQSFGLSVLGGESKDPDKVFEAFAAELEQMRSEGISLRRFEECRKKLYGRAVSGFNSVENVGHDMVSGFFAGMGPFDMFEAYANVQAEELTDYLNREFTPDRLALSVVLPL